MSLNNDSTNTNAGNNVQDRGNAQWIPPSNKDYYKAYGGKHNFMRSFGLKTYEPEAYDEARRICDMFREDDRLEWEERNKGK